MNKARNFIPAVIAVGLGVANGLWVFGPAFEEQVQGRNEKASGIDGKKPLGEDVTASIKAPADTPPSTATASASDNTSSGQPILSLGEKFSEHLPHVKENFEATERGQKPEVSSEV